MLIFAKSVKHGKIKMGSRLRGNDEVEGDHCFAVAVP